jgi:hypothetical protein
MLAGPFFTFLIPVFYIFQGFAYTSPAVIVTSTYYVAICAFCALPVFYPNDKSMLKFGCRVFEMVFEVIQKSGKLTIWPRTV